MPIGKEHGQAARINGFPLWRSGLTSRSNKHSSYNYSWYQLSVNTHRMNQHYYTISLVIA